MTIKTDINNLNLEKISTIKVSIQNKLLNPRIRPKVEFSGRQYCLSFSRPVARIKPIILMEFELGGTSISLFPENLGFCKTISHFFNFVQIAHWPAPLLSAAIEAACEPLLNYFSKITNVTLKLRTVQPYQDKIVSPYKKGLSFDFVLTDLEDNTQNTRGIICLPSDKTILQFVQALPYRTDIPTANNLKKIAFPFRIEIGKTILNASNFGELRAGDIILIENATPSFGENVLINIADTIHIMGELNKGRVKILNLAIRENLGMNSNNEQKDIVENLVENDTDIKIDTGDLPVNLVFELAQKQVTLGELETIKSGYIFETGLDVNGPIFIRANGVFFGKGKLIDIDGKLGVILENQNNAG